MTCAAFSASAMVGAYVTPVRLDRGRVAVRRRGGRGVPAEGLRVPGGGRAHAGRERRVVGEAGQHARVVRGIVASYEEAGLFVADRHRESAHRGREYRGAGR